MIHEGHNGSDGVIRPDGQEIDISRRDGAIGSRGRRGREEGTPSVHGEE